MEKLERLNIASGAPWEAMFGYSRAVRVGNLIWVAGTTASVDGAPYAPDDAYAQTVFILERIRQALEAAGARMENVVRTRLYVTDIADADAIGRAHGEVFRSIRPTATMVEVRKLIVPGLRVEIEVDAVIID